MRAAPLDCYTSVLLISPGVHRGRGAVGYHLSIFVLLFTFPGEYGGQPVPADLDRAVILNLVCLSTEFPLDPTSESWALGTVAEEKLI